MYFLSTCVEFVYVKLSTPTTEIDQNDSDCIISLTDLLCIRIVTVDVSVINTNVAVV